VSLPISLVKDTIMAEELLTTSEIHDKYGFARSTLLHWEEQGKLKPLKTSGGHRRYRRADIEAALSGTTSPNKPPEKVNYAELGTTGLTRWDQSTIYNEQLSELLGSSGIKLFHEMRTNDPVISAVFFAIESKLKQAVRRMRPASDKTHDRECAEFVDSCFDDMSSSFDDVMDNIMIMLEQGFAVEEPTYKRRLGVNPPKYIADPGKSKYTDGRVGWRNWAPRPAETLTPGNEWNIENGKILGCNQSSETGKSIALPIESILLFRTTAAPANSPVGRPIHRAMYVPYYYTKNYMEIEGIGVERDLNGVPVIYAGNDCTVDDVDYLRDIGVNLRNDEQMCVVIPKPKMGTAGDGMGVLVELLSSSNMRAHDVGNIIERLDKRKAVSVLAQFIMLGMDRVGSYALSTDQADLFNLSVGAWLNKIVDVINRVAIPRLLRYNTFPGITGYPELVMSDIGVTNLKEIGTFINTMVGRNVITVDDEVEQHMRQLGRLPEMPAELIGRRKANIAIGQANGKPKLPAQSNYAVVEE